MSKYEQVDLFAYIEDILLREKEQIEIRVQKVTSPLVEENFSVEVVETVCVEPKTSWFSQFKSGLTWLLHNIPNLFGLVMWVNVYTVSRAYGGSEAGGWYYRQYTCEDSRQVWVWDTDWNQLMLLRRYSKLAWGYISSETEGQEVAVLIETRKAAKQTSTKPHYDPKIVVSSLPKHLAVPSSKPILRLVENKRGVINRTSVLKEGQNVEPCDRCLGSGTTTFKHVENGTCFKCKGTGKRLRKSS